MLGAVRLVFAAAVVGALAYVLSWQILWGGMVGSEAPFHLHLITWVAGAFPNLPWWYPWDGMGVSYREAYPLAAHWLAVAISRAAGTSLEGGGQVVQFSLMPLTALGIYGFFDWRMRRPLAGLAAAVLFLLSPIAWVEWTHFGLYASWVGMVLLMPALIALDVFFFAWLRGDRSWHRRLGAGGFVLFTAALGVVSPHLLAAPLIAAAFYVLALPRSESKRAWRWLLAVVPALYAGVVLLSTIWLGGEFQYLAVVRSHWAGAGTNFDAGRLTFLDITSLLSLHPLTNGDLGDLYGISLAVVIPAVLGLALAWRVQRARVLAGLALVCVALLTVTDLYRPLFAVPGFAEFAVVAHRPFLLLLSVAAPALAALGLFELPRLVASAASIRWSWPRSVRFAVAAVLPVLLLVVFSVDVYGFAERADAAGHLAYGPSLTGAPDLRDLWLRHTADVCPEPGRGSNPLCGDRDLSSAFSIAELLPACRPAGHTRQDAPVCRGLQLDDAQSPSWTGDAGSITETDAWCQGRQDPVCAARYLPLSRQLLDASLWRMPAIRCDLGCPAEHESLAKLGQIFPSIPERVELNSNVAQLDMAFHAIVGGGITHSYNDQVIPSRELASWLEESMLTDEGLTTKAELAAALGIDGVVLSSPQSARAADYESLGWRQVSSDPIAFVNPQPSGLAAQWNGGSDVLVIGGTQTSVPALYNFVFKRATSGLLPFSSAWLVRGPSPYIDDYAAADLSRYSGVIVLGYQYHDQGTAWSRLDSFVRGGGRLFVETGWQYVDPDWNVGSAPSTLPVASLRWGALDPSAPVVVDGTVDPAFGRFTYGGGGWGASSASSVRAGATELVRAGDRVVAARWLLGPGRVVWSGMNLLAHDASSASADEDSFVARQLAWLFSSPAAQSQASLEPVWSGDGQASLPLRPSAGSTLVLFKESLFPGWSARLETPAGSQPVSLIGSEMDFMLARLDSVPAGSTLVFSYRPTTFEQASWAVSAATLLALIVWLVRPDVYVRGRRRLAAWVRPARTRVAGAVEGRLGRWDDEDELDQAQPRGEVPDDAGVT